jgi:hypothetical protein
MKEEIISIETLKELQELKKQKQEALEFIEKSCIYDEHLMGYVRGIERKDTGTLVYKLTGKYPRDIEREKNEKR